jgi:hypothetical protein
LFLLQHISNGLEKGMVTGSGARAAAAEAFANSQRHGDRDVYIDQVQA